MPRQSRTTFGRSLRTLAVRFILITIGLRPQRKRMMPPFATALTTRFHVQLARVPLPTQRSGFEVSTARAAGGTNASPSGLPAAFADAVEARIDATRTSGIR